MPRGLAAAAVAGGGGEAALGPAGLKLDLVAAALELLEGVLRTYDPFHRQCAWARHTRPERRREVVEVSGPSSALFQEIERKVIPWKGE